jgi:hypothetical protein
MALTSLAVVLAAFIAVFTAPSLSTKKPMDSVKSVAESSVKNLRMHPIALVEESHWSPSVKANPGSLEGELIPLEFRGNSVLAAEEVFYDDGSSEVQILMDVGLGQAKVLAVSKSTRPGSPYSPWFFYDAEKMIIESPRENWSRIVPHLISSGYSPEPPRYGAPVISVTVPDHMDYFSGKYLLECMVQGVGHVMLVPHPVQREGTVIHTGIDPAAAAPADLQPFTVDQG